MNEHFYLSAIFQYGGQLKMYGNPHFLCRLWTNRMVSFQEFFTLGVFLYMKPFSHNLR